MAKSVLIVDDNELNLELARFLLEEDGFHVKTARDAGEAMDLFDQVAPDLVLMDLSMPGVDGYELTRRMISKRDVKIAALTACALEEDEDRARRAGCSEFIRKPVDTHSFADMVSTMVELR